MIAADPVRDALYAYTLEHSGPAFVHQHVVDAFGAQHADARTTPLQLAFALVGLYLRVERGYTGRQVQRAHAVLSRRRPALPALVPPDFRGEVTAADVLAAPGGAGTRRCDRRLVCVGLGGIWCLPGRCCSPASAAGPQLMPRAPSHEQ
ncbi:MAG: DUF5946 family protein [Gemmatimonadaceae bacterium]|nr:DUF5946 family protein [Gemmatimonadaceae bacterium]